MRLATFLEAFRGVRRIGQRSKWTAECPAHDDRSRNTLHIALGADARRLLICRAGCRIEEVLAAAGLAPVDLFEEEASPPSRRIAGGRRKPDVPTLGAALRETLARARLQMAAYGPLYALADEIRATGVLVVQARRLAGLLGPDDERAWELAELAAALERDAWPLEAEQDQAMAELRRV